MDGRGLEGLFGFVLSLTTCPKADFTSGQSTCDINDGPYSSGVGSVPVGVTQRDTHVVFVCEWDACSAFAR